MVEEDFDHFKWNLIIKSSKGALDSQFQLVSPFTTLHPTCKRFHFGASYRNFFWATAVGQDGDSAAICRDIYVEEEKDTRLKKTGSYLNDNLQQYDHQLLDAIEWETDKETRGEAYSIDTLFTWLSKMRRGEDILHYAPRLQGLHLEKNRLLMTPTTGKLPESTLKHIDKLTEKETELNEMERNKGRLPCRLEHERPSSYRCKELDDAILRSIQGMEPMC